MNKCYNLFVSGDEEAWKSGSDFLDINRFGEYTIPELKSKFTIKDIENLKRYPCIFAYEDYRQKDPKFGFITEIVIRQKKIRISYEVVNLNNFLSYGDLTKYSFDLDIGDWELNRTHWAIKLVDLNKFMYNLGIILHQKTNTSAYQLVDITTHSFDVALTFPGEVRSKVESIAQGIITLLGNNSVFYDNYYKAQLARPSLDLLLQDIYRNRSRLIVVFLCEKYQEKDWCNLEFRAIRDIIKQRQHDKIMYIKMDDGNIDGVFSTDGYIDGKSHTANEIVQFIHERILLL